jgi:arylsulfatase A-like enzyme
MAGATKPNILIIWGDDIGWFNVSAYNMGLMGYKTPNIDRIGKEGMVFTDWYGQQSCTAGRAAFITGQQPIRTGLTKVGLPGAPLGIQPGDPTIAEMLKPFGYVCGQFGKNHLGDRDEFLPTVHGFDEFFGNLYHLNAEEEPEQPDYLLLAGRWFRSLKPAEGQWVSAGSSLPAEFAKIPPDSPKARVLVSVPSTD